MENIGVDKAAERSEALFGSGFYCAECVLLSLAEAKGIQSDLIPKIATGLCSGLSRTCGPCGAVSGAVLAINMLTGRNDPNDAVEDNYALVRRFLNLFKEKFGSIYCRELTGCDLGTEEGRASFKNQNLKAECFKYTKEATRIAMMLIQ